MFKYTLGMKHIYMLNSIVNKILCFIVAARQGITTWRCSVRNKKCGAMVIKSDYSYMRYERPHDDSAKIGDRVALQISRDVKKAAISSIFR